MLVLLLRLSPVQTFLGKRVTSYLNEAYNTNMVVKKVDFSFLGSVKLKGIEIKDHKKDSLIYVSSLNTSVFSYQNILDNKLELGDVEIDGLILNMITHEGESNDNLSVFVESFEDGKPSSGTPFIMSSSLMNLNNVNFILHDRNEHDNPIVFYKNINGRVEDFKVEGPNVFANIKELSFVEDHGIKVTELSTDFTYTKEQMNFTETTLKTEGSDIHGNIIFSYKREDLGDFNNKVMIDANFEESSVSLVDVNKFYNEFGENVRVDFKTKFKGVLNDFVLKDFYLVSNRNSKIDGELHFKNVINKEKGFSLDARIYDVSSNYQNLKRLLPNLLGKTLPSTFEKFGRFSLAGRSFITQDEVDAQVTIKSVLGRTISDLKLTNIDNIDDAEYVGNIEFVDLNLGKIVNDSLIGNVSLIADVDGKGFTLEKLNTSIKGRISKHQYKGYTYDNIDINGVFQNQKFNGNLKADDENLKMNFTGLADLSGDKYKLDFKANVLYSDFNKLNLFKRDSIAILKGDIDVNIVGNTIDNIVGEARFKNSSYTNQNDNYYFKDFNITSKFHDSVRVLKFNSSDIIDGTMKGRFKFDELEVLARNSLGSIYTNFIPEKVSSGQFLDFNFKIYNKIVGVFFPGINLGSNTTIKGEINSDEHKFDLLVKSPKVEAYDNIVEQIRLQIDNKNPLYNTLLSVDKVDTKYYDIADLNLVNVTLNDTLFFRTEFFGGKEKNEKFDLSFFHTINENNKSVIGVKKSNIKFKQNEWFINPNDNNQNKVVIDDNFVTYAFDKFNAISGNQKIEVAGVMSGYRDKDLSINLENVLLEGVTPEIDNLDLIGLVNGTVNYRQVKGDYLPTANLTIDNLKINNHEQGDLVINATGYNSLDEFEISASLQKDKLKSIDLKGEIDFGPEQPTIFANFTLDNYALEPYNLLGEGVLDKIRGKVSGKGVITGLLENPDINGELDLQNGGIAFPYLNVDYDFIGRSKVELNNQTFKFVSTTLVDVVHDTEAILEGTIRHESFQDWYLDLQLETNNLLVLNTKESEEIPYYGTGFLGKNDETGEMARAIIKGYTDQLNIDITGTTKPGTEFIIPLSDVNTIGDTKLISFVNMMDTGVDKNVQEEVIFDEIKGLTLNFDLEVNDDARAEIVIDKNTGSVLSGRGDGFLNIVINTNGRFDIFGTYVVSEGVYEFRNIVNKDFTVQPGGSVIWTGNPFNAYLNNITAVYRTRGNPGILLGNTGGSREVDVDLIAKISGQLLNSDIEFDLEIPNSSTTTNSELQFRLSDQDKKMSQFFSLLAFGDFTNTDENNFGFNLNATGGTIISEKISNVLSSLLKSRGDKFNVGISYDLGTRDNLNQALNTDDQLSFTTSTRLGKNIIVNGKVGVPVGGNTQSRVVGEVEIEVPLNKAETFRAKVYNKQNEVDFSVADQEGYTQGIGLSYQVDFDSGKELKEKIFGKKKTVQEKYDDLKRELEIKEEKYSTLKKEGKLSSEEEKEFLRKIKTLKEKLKKIASKTTDSTKLKNDLIQFTTIKKDTVDSKNSSQKKH